MKFHTFEQSIKLHDDIYKYVCNNKREVAELFGVFPSKLDRLVRVGFPKTILAYLKVCEYMNLKFALHSKDTFVQSFEKLKQCNEKYTRERLCFEIEISMSCFTSMIKHPNYFIQNLFKIYDYVQAKQVYKAKTGDTKGNNV